MTGSACDAALRGVLLLEPEAAMERLLAAGYAQVRTERTQGWRPGQLPRVVQAVRAGDCVVLTLADFPALAAPSEP